jgi:predicted nucleotidyltransferase
MQTRSPDLLPILRSRALADLLRVLFVSEGPPATISTLARAIGAAPSTVKREVDQLERAGIVRTMRAGRNRVVIVDRFSPLYPELRALFLKAFGPALIVQQAFASVDGIEELYLFGSWARRQQGEAGPPARDVDVLVVGDVEPDEVYRACSEAERVLGLDVNPTIVEREEWRSDGSPFLGTVRSGALLRLQEREGFNPELAHARALVAAAQAALTAAEISTASASQRQSPDQH